MVNYRILITSQLLNYAQTTDINKITWQVRNNS